MAPRTEPARRHFIIISCESPARSPTSANSASNATEEFTKRFVTIFIVAPVPFGPVYSTLAASGAIIRVPDDYTRVSAALFMASPFDTVLVAPGVYVENLLWPSTPGLKLLSEAGPDETILATAPFEQEMFLWDFETGEQLITGKGHTAGVYTAVFSPDGTTVLRLSDDQDDAPALLLAPSEAALTTTLTHG